MEKARNYTVFISYSHVDTGVAQLLPLHLEERAGAKSFIDRRFLKGGHDFQSMIEDHIKRSHEMIVLISEPFAKSEYFIYETAYAHCANTLVVPLLHQVARGRMQDFTFHRRHEAIDLVDFDRYINELSDRVQKHNMALRAREAALGRVADSFEQFPDPPRRN